MINKKLLLVLTIVIALVGASVSFSLLMNLNGVNTSVRPEISTDSSDAEETISSTPILNRDADKTVTNTSDIIDETDMGAALLEKVQEENTIADTEEIINSTDETAEDNEIASDTDEISDNAESTEDTEITDNAQSTENETTATTSDSKEEKKKKKKKGQDGPGMPIAKFTIETQGTIVRSGPNAEYAEIGSLPIGTTGEIIEKVNDYWVKINFNGDVGYIYSGYSKIEDL